MYWLAYLWSTTTCIAPSASHYTVVTQKIGLRIDSYTLLAATLVLGYSQNINSRSKF